MKTVKENLLFRLEKFGGILINKTTFARIELNKLEACFLYDCFAIWLKLCYTDLCVK